MDFGEVGKVRAVWGRVRVPALVAAGYVLLTCAFYWQGVVNIADEFISDGADGAMFLWNYWALPDAVLDGRNPFGSRLLFWPSGVRLGFHTTTPLEAFVIWPLGKVLGEVLATNLVLLAAVPLSGLGAFCLARHECHDDRVAFFAGAAFAFIPQHVGRINGHWNLMHTWVLPFGIWFLLRLYDKPTWKRGAVVGVMAGVIFLTDLTFFVFWLGAALIIATFRWRETSTRVFLKSIGLAALVGGVLSAPLLYAMASDLAHSELDALNGWGGAQEHSADLLGFVMPTSIHPFWGGLFDGFSPTIFGLEEYPYAGLVVLGLAVGAMFMRSVRRSPWPVLAAGSMLLALGPFLHINGRTGASFSKFGDEFTIPLPYYVFHKLPILSGLRIPGRFAIVGALALDVMAAIALSRVIKNRPIRWQWAIPAVALVVTMVELLPPPTLKFQSPDIPAAYKAIKRSDDKGAVMEIPIFWRDGFGQIGGAKDQTILMYYATSHGRPISNGMVARLPGKRWAGLFSVGPYRQVLSLMKQPGFTDAPVFKAPDLRAIGVSFVAYHRSRPYPEVLAYVESIGLEKLADDGETIVWRVPEGSGPTG